MKIKPIPKLGRHNIVYEQKKMKESKPNLPLPVLRSVQFTLVIVDF